MFMVENKETYNLPYLGSITDGFQRWFSRCVFENWPLCIIDGYYEKKNQEN